MKKIILAAAVVSLLSGCATRSLDHNVGNYCVSKNAQVGNTIEGLKVQWTSGGTGCAGNTPVHAKMVLPEDFIAPTMFKRLVESHDGDIGKVILLGTIGAESLSQHVQQNIIIRNCLLETGRTWACIPRDRREVYVNGYYRSNGTYVNGHYRTSPNSTRTDNYGCVGNPHTGKSGSASKC
jgi:uncharacterized protein YceK